jgi:hypothetical protein
MRNRQDDYTTLALYAVVALLILLAGFGIAWVRATVQTNVYKRQGVDMSVWEVLLGAKPIERVLKETP